MRDIKTIIYTMVTVSHSPEEIERALDDALRATFPASDPIAIGCCQKIEDRKRGVIKNEVRPWRVI